MSPLRYLLNVAGFFPQILASSLEHFHDPEFKAVARRYFKTVDLVDENGQTYQDVSLEKVEDQRLAAEEYIAHIAEKEVKPSWWKEFLQKIRMAFAHLPGFKDVTMTDQQIEILLARAARKVTTAKRNSAVEVGGSRLTGS